MNTQNKSDPPQRRKFGWFGLREKLRIFKQMYKFHSTWIANQALRAMFRAGKAEGLKECPIVVYGREIAPSIWGCEHTTPLFVLGPGILTCTECRKIDMAPLQIAPPVARPTIRLVPEVERSTGPIIRERPVFAYRRQLHPDAEAGEDTQHLRSIRKGGIK